MRTYNDWLNVRRKLQLREAVRKRRERIEERRWESFLISREAFDERLECEMDAYELMMRNQNGCGW